MAEVRRGVDAVDAELVNLLVRRFAYMDAAAGIKKDRSAVRDDQRKLEVLANVERHAINAGLDPQRIRAVWDMLVEQSIAHELLKWDDIRSSP